MRPSSKPQKYSTTAMIPVGDESVYILSPVSTFDLIRSDNRTVYILSPESTTDLIPSEDGSE